MWHLPTLFLDSVFAGKQSALGHSVSNRRNIVQITNYRTRGANWNWQATDKNSHSIYWWINETDLFERRKEEEGKFSLKTVPIRKYWSHSNNWFNECLIKILTSLMKEGIWWEKVQL